MIELCDKLSDEVKRLKDLATPLRTVVSTSAVVSASTFLWLEVAVIRYRGDSRQIDTRLPRERYSELGKQRGYTSNVRPHHIPFPNQLKHGRMEVENLPWGIGILSHEKLCENLRRRTVRTVGHAHITLQKSQFKPNMRPFVCAAQFEQT